MGRSLLIWRLVVGDIKHRPVQSLLLMVMIVTTTTTLSLGSALRHASQNPFARTRVVTKGPDYVAETGPAPGSARPSPSQFAPLIHDRWVTATAGPFPVAFTRLTAPNIDLPVDAEGRDKQAAAVDQPLLTAGHWASSGAVVIEQGLAEALSLRVGETIALGGRSFHVVGIAVTTARAFYPARKPGLVWLTRADADSLATGSEPLGYVLNIKLAANAPTSEPLAAGARSSTRRPTYPQPLQGWPAISADDYRVIALDQKVILIGSWLLAMLAIASIAVVVGGRMAEQSRRVGLLKAVGAKPGLCCRGARLRKPAARARRGVHWTARGHETRACARKPWPRVCRSHANPAADDRLDRARRRCGGRGRRRGDARPGATSSADQHDPRAQRPCPPTAATATGDRAVRGAAGVAAARVAPHGAPPAPHRAHRREPDDRRRDGRRGTGTTTRDRGHPAGPHGGRLLPHQWQHPNRESLAAHPQPDPRSRSRRSPPPSPPGLS